MPDERVKWQRNIEFVQWPTRQPFSYVITWSAAVVLDPTPASGTTAERMRSRPL